MSADPEQRRRFLSIIQRSLDRASDLVDDLSTVLSRYGSAPSAPRRRTLSAVIKDARFEVAPAAHQAGLALDVATPAPRHNGGRQLTPAAELSHVVAVMQRAQVPHLSVGNGDGRMLGVIAEADLARR